MDRKMEIISNLSEICNNAVVLCKLKWTKTQN